VTPSGHSNTSDTYAGAAVTDGFAIGGRGTIQMKRPRSIVASIGAHLAILGLVLGALVAGPTSAGAQTNPYQRGPNPSALTLLGRGPFAVSQTTASGGLGAGFNNVTVYYPNDTSQGTFAGVVVSPGFLSPKALMQWAGPKIASHGFVVAIMEPNSILDFPAARADQMQAILRWFSTGAPTAVRQRLDTNRLGVMGHSMGGGGSLQVGTRDNPEVNAVVALQPFDIFASYAASDTPTMVIGAQNDIIASVGLNAEPFYNSMSRNEKQYVELSGQGHLVGITDNAQQSAAAIAWFKRFLDNDTRYNQFLCPPMSGLGIAETRSTCPY
jgi:hypothetical protein